MATSELLNRARTGDEAAFSQIVDPYRREIQAHCYRILGSVHDAEDLCQETLLAAWQGIGSFEGRSSVRTWLYRIATNRCLNALRAVSRRPVAETPPFEVALPEPTRLSEVLWLDPYPDVLIEEFADGAPGPDSRYESAESISLAFVTALQMLPPRQRAVLILRDVLGYPASEAAAILDVTEESVTSALKRARAGMSLHLERGEDGPPPAPHSKEERDLVQRLTVAYEAGDLHALVSLFSSDVWLRMPPAPLEYQGRELARQFLAAVAFRPGSTFRLVPTRANGQPAFGLYVKDLHTDIHHASGLLVLTLAGDKVQVLTRFDNSVLASFGLPRTLPPEQA
jgi:RNA polymerase sigma-70 factor (TIGR02960 family)